MTVEACPHCDHPSLSYRKDGSIKCCNCKRVFDEPNRRPPRPNRKGGAAKLAKLDPEDVGLGGGEA